MGFVFQTIRELDRLQVPCDLGCKSRLVCVSLQGCRCPSFLTRKFPAAQLTRMSRPPSCAQVCSTHRSQS